MVYVAPRSSAASFAVTAQERRRRACRDRRPGRDAIRVHPRDPRLPSNGNAAARSAATTAAA